jgi:hypothetical protein
MAKLENKTAITKASKVRDPTIEEIGDPKNLNNYLPDLGATQHMTPRLADLQNTVEGQKIGVEVANGHIIKCSITGNIQISMQDDNGNMLTATLSDVMYVPGLNRRLFSVTQFAQHGHCAIVQQHGTTLLPYEPGLRQSFRDRPVRFFFCKENVGVPHGWPKACPVLEKQNERTTYLLVLFS